MKRKIICKVCNGNGFVRVPYEQAREEQFANCEFCESQGEVEEEEEQNDTRATNINLMVVYLYFFKIS